MKKDVLVDNYYKTYTGTVNIDDCVVTGSGMVNIPDSHFTHYFLEVIAGNGFVLQRMTPVWTSGVYQRKKVQGKWSELEKIG